MAKVAFSKLGVKTNNDVKTIEWDGQAIEVLQYLPIQQKLELIGNVVSYAHEENINYSNPVKIKVFTALEILYQYTNISFTEKQKADIPKLYDTVFSSGLLSKIIENIPSEEYNIIERGIQDSIEAIYKYQNSIIGILDILKGDVDEIENINMDGIKSELTSILEMPMVKELLTQLD